MIIQIFASHPIASRYHSRNCLLVDWDYVNLVPSPSLSSLNDPLVPDQISPLRLQIVTKS